MREASGALERRVAIDRASVSGSVERPGRGYHHRIGHFLVTTVHGPQWDASRGIREQDAWDAHASFMDQLVDEGFVILGGPIGDRAMLVVEADSADQIERRMAADPWKPMGILHVGAIEPWTIWLDGRAARTERQSL